MTDPSAADRTPRFEVVGLDHVVIMAADVERSIRFYCDTLGLEGVRCEEWRRGEVFFPSVRVDATTILDILAAEPDGRNIDHLALVVEVDDLEAWARHQGLEIVEGPATRFGAQGDGTSIYITDPDGNTIELKQY